MANEYAKGVKVVSRTGNVGELTGSQRFCQLEGCRGKRLYVRWKDGKITIPCTKGMTFDETTYTWKIL